MKISPNAITNSAALLEALPTQESHTLRDAIQKLHPNIEAALQKGYSYEELALIMKEQGVPVSVSSLKRYLTEVRASIRKKPRKTRKTSATVVQSPEADAVVESEPVVESRADEPTLIEAPEEVVDTQAVAVPAKTGKGGRKSTRQSAGKGTGKDKPPQSRKTAARSKTDFRTRATAAKKSKTSR